MAPNEKQKAQTKIIQSQLSKILGTELLVDGWYGNETKSGVIKLQDKFNLAETGVVDSQTLYQIEMATTFKNVPRFRMEADGIVRKYGTIYTQYYKNLYSSYGSEAVPEEIRPEIYGGNVQNDELGNFIVDSVLFGVGSIGKQAVKSGLKAIGSLTKKVTSSFKEFIKSLDDIIKKGAGKSVDPNKLNHIFGKSEHNLGGLLKKYGGDQTKAFNALESATQKYVNTNNVTGNFKDIVVNVNGVNVTVRGTVIDGQVKIGTAFIP